MYILCVTAILKLNVPGQLMSTLHCAEFHHRALPQHATEAFTLICNNSAPVNAYTVISVRTRQL